MRVSSAVPFTLCLALSTFGCGDDSSSGDAGGSSGSTTDTSTSSTSSTSSTTTTTTTTTTTDTTTSTSTTSTGSTSTTDGTGSTGGSTGATTGAILPAIDQLDPASGIVTTVVTATGSGFGDAQGAGTLTVDGTPATVNSWSDTSIEFGVPDVFPGARDVVITNDGADSDTAQFDVTLPQVLYVNNDTSPNTLSAYDMDAAGALTPLTNSPFATGHNSSSFGGDSSSLIMDRTTRRLFNAGDTSVAVFDIDPVTGELTAVANSPFSSDGSRGFGLVLSQGGGLLYMANCTSNDISGFAVDPLSGALALLADSPFSAAGAGCLDTPHLLQGDAVLAATDEGNAMYVYTVGNDGALTVTLQSPLTVVNNYTSRADPTGVRLYMPDLFNNAIDIWEIDAAGVATQNAAAPIALGGAFGPHTLRFTPDGQRLYVGSWNGTVVTGHAVAANGSVSDLGWSPFDTTVDNHSGMRFTAAGDFMVLATEGDGIRVHSVAADGALTPVAGSPFAFDGVNAAPSALVLAQ